MKNLLLSARFIIVFSILNCFTTPLWAANANSVNENFATIQGDGGNIYWFIHPSVKFESIKLTLSADTDDFDLTLESELEPSTGPLDDGGYQYELVVTPLLGASVKAELKAARAAAGGQETADIARSLKAQGKIPEKRQVQSGHFMLVNGQLVSDAEVE